MLQWSADGAGSVAGAVGGAVTNEDQLSLNSFSLQGWRTEETLRLRTNGTSDDETDRFGKESLLFVSVVPASIEPLSSLYT